MKKQLLAVSQFGLVFGLYLGQTFKRFRAHRKSAEVQTVFSRKNLNESRANSNWAAGLEPCFVAV